MKEHSYKGNKIIEHNDGTFEAFYMTDGDILSMEFKSLTKAEKFLDKNGYSVENEF